VNARSKAFKEKNAFLSQAYLTLDEVQLQGLVPVFGLKQSDLKKMSNAPSTLHCTKQKVCKWVYVQTAENDIRTDHHQQFESFEY
jgi:hypothetical protein